MDKLSLTRLRSNIGFSLIELSIVITIVGILLYSAISVGTSQMDVAKVKATKEKLEKIENAITIYYKLNAYIPCPADGSLAISNTNFGKSGENYATPDCLGPFTTAGPPAAASIMGSVPTRSLNLPDDYVYDSWGNRISYIMYSGCAKSGAPTAVSWATNYTTIDTCQTLSKTTSLLTIKDGNSTPRTISTAAAYVLVSHGKDGFGAWPKAGGATRKASAANTSTQENDNALNTGDLTYTDAAFNDGNVDANADGVLDSYFDDVVRWRTPGQIYYDANH